MGISLPNFKLNYTATAFCTLAPFQIFTVIPSCHLAQSCSVIYSPSLFTCFLTNFKNLAHISLASKQRLGVEKS